MRALNTLMSRGAKITESRLIESEDGLWTIQVRLSGLKGVFIINQYDRDEPKRYKDIALAIRTVWADLGYMGTILLTTERDQTPRMRAARANA